MKIEKAMTAEWHDWLRIAVSCGTLLCLAIAGVALLFVTIAAAKN